MKSFSLCSYLSSISYGKTEIRRGNQTIFLCQFSRTIVFFNIHWLTLNRHYIFFGKACQNFNCNQICSYWYVNSVNIFFMYKMPIHFMKTNFIDLDPEIKQFKELCLEMSQERRLTCHFFCVK